MRSAASRAPYELIEMLSIRRWSPKSPDAFRGACNASEVAASPHQKNCRRLVSSSSSSSPTSSSLSSRPFLSSSSLSSSPKSFSSSALSDDESPSPSSAKGKINRIGATVGLLGAGAMGEAFARGLLAAGVVSAADLRASVRTEERRVALSSLIGPERVFGDALSGGARLVAESSDVIVVGVKPDAVPEVLEALAPHLDVSRHLVVSIAAGVTLGAMSSKLPEGAKIARVMPNTPTLVGNGASVYCLNESASGDSSGGDSNDSGASSSSSSSSSSSAAIVRAMLEAVGLALPLDESLMDAATGLSGCGPAYVFLMIEALSDGGVKAGLPRDAATRLAAATVGGAAQMVLEAGPGRGEGRARGAGFFEENSDDGDGPPLRELAHPAVLRERVCSPGGATIAGVAVLEDAGVRGAVARAVVAAAARAAELASKK